MKNKQIVIKNKKMELADYFKPIGFMILLIVLGVLLNSSDGVFFQNVFSIITIIILIVLIPLNQIFRVKKIHIYEIYAENDRIGILYQDILRDREIKLFLKESQFEKQNTNIRGCCKMKISTTTFELEQYCNKYWTNDIIEKINIKLNDLKKTRAVIRTNDDSGHKN